MKCHPNCGKCCGLIPLPKTTFQKHQDKIQVEIKKLNSLHTEKVLAVTEDLMCIFFNRNTKTCSIYQNRPKICQDYGPPECIKWKDHGTDVASKVRFSSR